MPTPMRHMRVADDVWEPAMARSQREGTSITAVVVEFLRAYGQGPAPKRSGRRRAAATGEADCPHPPGRVHKGLCGACGNSVL